MKPEQKARAFEALHAVQRLATLAANLSKFDRLTEADWKRYAKLLGENADAVLDGHLLLSYCVTNTTETE